MEKSLYQIQGDYLELASLLEESGGELTDDLEERLAINQDELNQKAENYALLIRQIEGKVSVIKAEMDRLKVLMTSKQNTATRLKDNIKKAMDMYDVKSIEGTLVKLTLRNNAASVVISDDAKIPKKFIVKTVSEAPDKKAIKEHLQGGKVIAGVTLVSTQSVMIK